MLVGQRQYQPLSMDIMDHALYLKTPAFSTKLPTGIGSIFPPECRARGLFLNVFYAMDHTCGGHTEFQC